METLLDIITVTKDDFDGLAATIQSTEQLRDKDRVRQIIVDSSNNEICQKIKESLVNEKKVDYIWQKPSGIAPAFNAGLSVSKAKWVWFLNGKDEIHPDVDASNLIYIIKNSRADAIIFQTEYKQSGRKPKHPPMWALWPPMLPNWIPHPSIITRRKLYDQYGQFDDSFKIAMDYDVWMRFFSNNIIIDMISIPIALFDEKGISGSQPEISLKESSKIIKKNILYFIKLWCVAKMKSIARPLLRIYRASLKPKSKIND